MTHPLIRVEGITVRLGDRWLLHDTSWRIDRGEQWAVVGPNGAGKTTLAKAIAGLVPVIRGKIDYPGFAGLAPLDAIAYVASDARRIIWRRERNLADERGFAGRFNDATTVRELIGRRSGGRLDPPEMARRLTDVVDSLSLENLLNKPVLAISTGEMSRVLVACQLIRQPKMLILDEPFEGLDTVARGDLIERFDRLARSGLAIISIIHRCEEMLPATTHLLTLAKGRIVASQAVNRRRPPVSRVVDDSAGRRPGWPEGAFVAAEKGGRLPSEPLIDMQTVTVRYGDTVVLDRFTWRVENGQNWAISGPNGAGKSTILKLISGECLQVYANRIRLFGRALGSGQTLGELRQQLGIVSHDLAAGYQKQISALEVVCSGFFDSIGLYRHADGGQIAIARRWLARMGMAAPGASPFNRLSQGERQMILIARAMVKAPRLLILDEPCSGLDAHNRRRILDLLSDIGRGAETGLIVISHFEQDIPACTTHRLVLDHGTVVACGPLADRSVRDDASRHR